MRFEGPGLIAEVAAAHEIRLDVRHMDCGEPVPDVSEIGGLVVMGGPMGVSDVADHPHLAAEQALIRAAVERDLPVLGVCLGAQLLAAALGAQVFRGASLEIGIGEVTLTPEGLEDRVLGGGPAALPVIHWHQDTFSLPARGIHLARSALYPNQAFRAGSRAYAFQFHVEVDREMAAEWAAALPPAISLDEDRRALVECHGRRILDRFFEAVLAR